MRSQDLPVSWRHDPVIGSHPWPSQGYLTMGSHQYMQIFRSSFHFRVSALHSGQWLEEADFYLYRHLELINYCLEFSVPAIIQSQEQFITVGEGSGPHPDKGIRPIRTMAGERYFQEHAQLDGTPGLLALKGRLLKLVCPYGVYSPITGEVSDEVFESSWLSEIALGYQEDGGIWEENPTIWEEAQALMKGPATL